MELYNKTDQKIHLLSQPIAKANRTFVQAKKDDSHTNLYFDPLSNRILGRWIDTGKGKVILALNLTKQTYEWLNDKLIPIAAVAYSTKTMDEIETEIAESLMILGISPDGYKDPMHYKIPEYDFINEAFELINAENISQWTHFRKLANETCQLVLGHLQIEKEIRIWPHHFDTGIYIEPNDDLGIGFGLAMEDDMVEAPYFYLSGYSKTGKINYLNLPDISPARWELTENWEGAVLPINTLEDTPYKSFQKTLIDYLNKSLEWYLQMRIE
ncbi:MAG TPA: hypothetical protein VJ937_14490 [Salinivirga sp.]|uniref:hypothetical protein n=1 Tax=Salinivirga sp. TaxID=1970192 RepID=UPI002B49827F|nr:hypothetical protein [Salinivirga sp.]HKK60686.1 hypothetical protein [Salinivirga sp.]